MLVSVAYAQAALLESLMLVRGRRALSCSNLYTPAMPYVTRSHDELACLSEAGWPSG